MDAQLDPRTVQEAARVLIDDLKDPTRAQTAVKRLILLGPRVIDPLMGALKNPSREVRIGVSVALGEIGEERAVQPLLRCLEDSWQGEKPFIALTLGYLGDPQASASLVKLLRDSNWKERLAAAIALGLIREKRAVPALRQAIGKEELSHSVEAALNGFGRGVADGIKGGFLSGITRGIARSIPGAPKSGLGGFIVHSMTRDTLRALVPRLPETKIWTWEEIEYLPVKVRIPKVCESMASALAMIGSESIDTLVELCQGESVPARVAAIKAVSVYVADDERVLPILLASSKNKNAEVRASALEALALAYAMGKFPQIDPFITGMKDRDARVRRAAAAALGPILCTEGGKEIVEALAEAFRDRAPEVRAEAVFAFAQWDSPQALQPFRSAFRHREPEMRLAAVVASRWCTDQESLGLTVAALGDRDARVRAAAAETLGERGDSKPLQPLRKLTRDRDVSVRANAILALGKLRDTDMGLFRRALRDSSDDVRGAAICGLGEIGSAEATTALIGILAHKDEMVAELATSVLGTLDESAMPQLINALQSSNPRVRAGAATALGDIGDARAIDPIQRLLRDRQKRVRRAAVVAFALLAAGAA